jgi:hypothetical protein
MAGTELERTLNTITLPTVFRGSVRLRLRLTSHTTTSERSCVTSAMPTKLFSVV